MVTLKLTQDELTYLEKVRNAFCGFHTTLDAKPNANQVWEALKGVVG